MKIPIDRRSVPNLSHGGFGTCKEWVAALDDFRNWIIRAA